MSKKPTEPEEEIEEIGEDEIVELTADDGRTLQFYHEGTIRYKGQWYVMFCPAEEIEGLADDEAVIFRISDKEDEKDVLLPVEDEALLEEVYEEFCRVQEEEDAADEAMALEGGCDCGECDCDECGEDEDEGPCCDENGCHIHKKKKK